MGQAVTICVLTFWYMYLEHLHFAAGFLLATKGVLIDKRLTVD